MSFINITNIIIPNNSYALDDKIRFQVSFECYKALEQEIEWKITYIGNPSDSKQDQILESFGMGPLDPGELEFEIEANPPDMSKFSDMDIIGVAAIVVSISYFDVEFFRAGYFVSVNYDDPVLIENPFPIQRDKLFRRIMVDKPRVVHQNVDWESIENKIQQSNHQDQIIEEVNTFCQEDGGNYNQNMNLQENNPYHIYFSKGPDSLNIDKTEKNYLSIFLNSEIVQNVESLFGFQRNPYIYSNQRDF